MTKIYISYQNMIQRYTRLLYPLFVWVLMAKAPFYRESGFFLSFTLK